MAFDNNRDDKDIIQEAKKRFTLCEDWEAQWRVYAEYDYKFANGDSHNMYQWDNDIVVDRRINNRPMLTVNKTNQHNLMVINDSKQNKPGVIVRPVGEKASFEAAQVYQGVIRHIEYISNAENAYDNATEFQVQCGIGYWRICVDYESDDSFNQEIYIRPIKDYKLVYLDPYISQSDGSDARFGFIFEDLPKDLYQDTYPDFKDIGWSSVFGQKPDTWVTKDTIRVAEYFRKSQINKKLVTFIMMDGEQITSFYDELNKEQKEFYKLVKDAPTSKERDVVTDNIEWFKIAGNQIIDRGPWLGKYIPIVRCVGTETVIDGIMDRKGHTRQLLDPQRIYNYNTSANVEYGALQTKAPWVASVRAVDGFENYWGTANTKNHSYLPYNDIDETGNDIPAPEKPAPPQASPAYVQQLQIAQNEMMMATGQYQAQIGENENAKSGIAINARQRQGDRATYHFIDNQAKGIRFTGKQLIDLIPKVYDTPRIIQINAMDGSVMNVTIDVNSPESMKKINKEDDIDESLKVQNIIFNPAIGTYDIVSDVGPSYATRRQEAFNALMQIAAQNPNFMGIAGDILWKVADFPEAQVLTDRWRKIIPPNITGDGPDPQVQEAIQQAAAKVEQMLAVLAQQAKELADKEREFEIKAYEAETKRLVAIGNAGPIVTAEQVKPVLEKLLVEMQENEGSAHKEPDEDNGVEQTNMFAPNGQENQEATNPNLHLDDLSNKLNSVTNKPSMSDIGARKAPDGNYYIENPNDPGKYMMVQENG